MSEFLKITGVILGALIAAVGLFTYDANSEFLYLLGLEDAAWVIMIAWGVSGIITGTIIYALGMILEHVEDIKKGLQKEVPTQTTVTENV
ncbi:hypothetical protein ACQKLN_29680 [Paenibacillus glucanolyticus]|uniref:hypothetical protein n=1 Tax=Paenibacillus glucanolyticus TaxID=59843 RepID=UPI0036A56481